MTDFVIDASVVIKWVIEEPGTKQALSLRRHRLFAPDPLVAECANVLWKKVRRKELSAAEATLAASLLARAQIDLEPMRPLFESATRLAIEPDHPAYDCVYLALAENRGCDFVTADDSLSRKPLPAPMSARIINLSTVPLS